MAGKVNAEIVKINESLWLTQNSGGNKLVAYYPVTDVTKVLATEDGVSGDISSAVSTHNSDNTAHTAIQTKIGTDISTHNSDDAAHTAIQAKIGTDIGTHNSDSSAHTAIQTKIGTDIGTHNGSGTAHSDIRTALSTHTGDTSNPHGVTLPQLTGGTFNYDEDNDRINGGDARINNLGAIQFSQANQTTPTTFFEQQCGSNGLPEIIRKTPADSVPVNVGSPFMSGMHWGVMDNTPLAKLTVPTAANTSFTPFGYMNPTGANVSTELSFYTAGPSRATFPDVLVLGAIYRISAGVRFYQTAGGTTGTHTLNLYLWPDTQMIGQWTRGVSTSASDAWQEIDLTFKVAELSSTQFAILVDANQGGRSDYHVINKTAVPTMFFGLSLASGNAPYGTYQTIYISHLEVYRIK